MKTLFKVSLMVLLFLLCGCGGPGQYDAAYVPSIVMPLENQAHLLKNNDRPMVIMTPDLEKDLETLIHQNYVIVGESKFNGPEEGIGDAISVAKKHKVTHVLLNAKYAYDASKKAYKFIENFDYIPYESGYVIANNRSYRQIYYERIPNPIAVPYKKNLSIYHHRAVFLVKLKH